MTDGITLIFFSPIYNFACVYLSYLKLLKKEEPIGYVSSHPGKEFLMLTTKRDIILECTLEHHGKIKKVGLVVITGRCPILVSFRIEDGRTLGR